jgi:hypothetical protein
MSVADKFYALQVEADRFIKEWEREQARELEARHRAEQEEEEHEQARLDSREGRDEKLARDLWESTTLRLGHYAEEDEED